MLKKENKLKLKVDFEWAFRHSKPVFTKNLTFRVVYAPKRSKSGELLVEKPPRFGFIISSKVEKLAVKRNAIKRILNEAARKYLDELSSNLMVVVVIKGKFNFPLDKEGIEKDFDYGLRKALSLINNPNFTRRSVNPKGEATKS